MVWYIEGGLERAAGLNSRTPQTSRFTSVLYPRDAYDQAGGTLVEGDSCVTLTKDHGVQNTLLGPPALVDTPCAWRIGAKR